MTNMEQREPAMHHDGETHLKTLDQIVQDAYNAGYRDGWDDGADGFRHNIDRVRAALVGDTSPCPLCGGPTFSPDPLRKEEQGHYCDTCGQAHDPVTRTMLQL